MKIPLQQFVFTLVLLFSLILNISAQETTLDKIILKTGESFVGQIVVQTSEIVLIKTTDGSRFQFPLTSIKSIEKVSVNEKELTTIDTLSTDHNFSSENFCIMLDLSGGISKGNFRYPWMPAGEVSMSFGTKKLFNETVFAGLGIAYNVIPVSTTQQTFGFIPVFVRFQSNNLTKQRTSPYLSLDAGYAFSTNKNSGGGILAKFSTGIIHKISYKMSVYGGLFARVQQFSGVLTESVNSSTVTYNGNSSMYNLGAKVGIQF